MVLRSAAGQRLLGGCRFLLFLDFHLLGGQRARYVGVIGVLIPLCVYFYYVFIESWCLGYFWRYVTGGIGVDASAPMNAQAAQSSEHWRSFIGFGADGELFTAGHGGVLAFWLITMALNMWFVFRGLSKGIEAFCKWAMPAMPTRLTIFSQAR